MIARDADGRPLDAVTDDAGQVWQVNDRVTLYPFGAGRIAYFGPTRYTCAIYLEDGFGGLIQHVSVNRPTLTLIRPRTADETPIR